LFSPHKDDRCQEHLTPGSRGSTKRCPGSSLEGSTSFTTSGTRTIPASGRSPAPSRCWQPGHHSASRFLPVATNLSIRDLFDCVLCYSHPLLSRVARIPIPVRRPRAEQETATGLFCAHPSPVTLPRVARSALGQAARPQESCSHCLPSDAFLKGALRAASIHAPASH
jgi:hypothetical protein